MTITYLKKILTSRVYELAKVTPLELAPVLSRRYGCNIRFKREDLQPVFSFKLRGAYNKIASLTTQQREKGVITASAGNHAQGVAMSATRMGIRSVIVMPITTPEIKVNLVQSQGGEVVLFGENFSAACNHAYEIAEQEELVFVHPYDDPHVIAGNGTVGMEILQQHTGPLQAIFVPVGGGGLLAGISAYVKELRPEVQVIGVEAEDSACLYEALNAGERVTLPRVGIFADGTAVAQIGKETFRIAQACVDDVVTVTTDQICAAIKDIFEETRSIVEPSGALALAGLKKYLAQHPSQNSEFVTVLSGANINFKSLRHISERTELGADKEAFLAVKIPIVDDWFRGFCDAVQGYPITGINYRSSSLPHADLFVAVGLTPLHGSARLIEKLQKCDYSILDLSDNELAKVFLSNMVGGHLLKGEEERIFRFVFPERPGALLDFTNAVSHRFNLTLLHYRNMGAAYGRVLVGIRVPDGAYAELADFLASTGYDYVDETSNPACRLFLGLES